MPFYLPCLLSPFVLLSPGAQFSQALSLFPLSCCHAEPLELFLLKKGQSEKSPQPSSHIIWSELNPIRLGRSFMAGVGSPSLQTCDILCLVLSQLAWSCPRRCFWLRFRSELKTHGWPVEKGPCISLQQRKKLGLGNSKQFNVWLQGHWGRDWFLHRLLALEVSCQLHSWLEPSLRVTLWSLNDLSASPCPPLRGGGMWLLMASAGGTDGLFRWIDRKTFLHFNKSAAEAALGYCHPHFPPHTQWQGWAEHSERVFMEDGMALSPQSAAKLLQWVPALLFLPQEGSEGYSSSLCSLQAFENFGGSRDWRGRGGGIKLLLPDSARNHRFFPRFSTF